MGGSSFIFTCLAIGIILSVARNVEQIEGKNKDEQATEPIKQKLCKNLFLEPFESAIPDNIGEIKETNKNDADSAYEYKAVFTNSLPKKVTELLPLFEVTAEQ